MDQTSLYANSPTSIELSNGKRFDVLAPDPDVFDIEVIAISLARLCRYTGHCREFYSVAQHSVVVSDQLAPKLALDGLLHDASEAFIGDVSRPLKVALETLAPGVLRGIEENIHRVIAEKYGTRWPHPPEVKHADNVALATERRDLMPPDEVPWANLPDPSPRSVVPWRGDWPRKIFLERFRELEVKR